MKKIYFLISLLFFYSGYTQSIKKTPVDKNSIELNIKSDKYIYKIGDTLKLKVIFKNKSKDDFQIVFRKGCFHFRQLNLYQNNKKLKRIGICREKIAALGFFESDYSKIEQKKSIEFELKLLITSLPTEKKCFSKDFYPSGYAFLCNKYGVLFKNFDKFNVQLDYQIKFPNSTKESLHSAYHKKKNVWEYSLISNNINFKIKKS